MCGKLENLEGVEILGEYEDDLFVFYLFDVKFDFCVYYRGFNLDKLCQLKIEGFLFGVDIVVILCD